MTAEALDVRAELRALIEHRSVALEAIAQMTGISESTLSAYLAGPGTEHQGLTALGTGLTPRRIAAARRLRSHAGRGFERARR
ncbi:hypothetical protein Q9Q99_10220 [Curtobacterium flaccumfaciens]|nr:hypothetical protein Q9Q99_10220 [Curtobacterium flaccumfaciens]